ncbi:hypothetical protein ACH82I_16310 [Brevibacterium sp. GP-SGM9]|uniref:hypothetical protein n=1 Tax=Brevibacterium sp. GP-SGM9 TaxID=3376990 RepID=UPI0039A4C3A9
MSKPYALAGLVLGLAVFAGIFILLLPGLFEHASSGRVWVTWVIFGIAVAFGAGLILARSRGRRDSGTQF